MPVLAPVAGAVSCVGNMRPAPEWESGSFFGLHRDYPNPDPNPNPDPSPNPNPNPNPNPSPSLNPNPNRVDTAKGEAMHARDATRGAAHGLARVGRAVEGQVEEGRQRVGRVVQAGQVRARVRVVLLDAPDRDTRLVRARRELRARLRTGLRARRGRTVSSTLMTLAMVKMAGPQLLS